MSTPATIVEVLAMLDRVDACIAVSIVDRLYALPDMPDRRFMATAEMRAGWQLIETAPSRHEALAKLAIIIRDNVPTPAPPAPSAEQKAEEQSGRQIEMWRTP